MDIEQRVYENEDGIMSKAQTKDEYITAWNYHIDELTSLGWPLVKISKFEELKAIQAQLKELVLEAAEVDFPSSDIEQTER